MNGSRPDRMPVYGAGSKRLGRREKEKEWPRFLRARAPGNFHCAPTCPFKGSDSGAKPWSVRAIASGNSHCAPTSVDNIRQRTRGLSAKTSAIYTLWLLEYINCDQPRRRRPLIFKPVGGLLVFRPEISRTNLSGYAASMLGSLTLEYVDRTGPVLVVVNPDDASGFDGQHAHPELAPSHAFDLGGRDQPRQVASASRLCFLSVPAAARLRSRIPQ